MKVAIFSDIHGNGYAFEKLCTALDKECCDAWIFLGDLCGYYYDQDEIIDKLCRAPFLLATKGNHDNLFLQNLNDKTTIEEYMLHYGKSNKFLLKTISQKNITFLHELPESLELEEYGIFACHGSPWDYLNEYVYPDDKIDRFGELPHRLILLGHTHHPMDLKRNGLRIVNPGSAGQPRDGRWPSYAVYETDSDELEIKRFYYDVDPLIEDIKRRHERNPYLIEVLMRMKGQA